MATLLQTDFTQADSTTVVPAPSIGPTPAYTGTGTYGTLANVLYAPSAGDVRLIYPLTTPDIWLTTKVINPSADGSIIFRAQDSNNFLLVHWGGTQQLQFYRCVAGAFQGPIVNLGNGTIANGDIVEIRCKGESIQVYRNGAVSFGVVEGKFTASGGVGYRNSSGDTTSRYDDLLVKDYADLTLPTNLGLSPVDFVGSALTPRPSYVYKGRDTAAADTGSVA